MISAEDPFLDKFAFSLALFGLGAVIWTGLGQTVNFFFIGLIILCTLVLRMNHKFLIGFKGVKPLVFASLFSTIISVLFSIDTSSKASSIRENYLSASFLIFSDSNVNPIISLLKWIISLYVLPTFIITIRKISSKKYELMLIVWIISVSLSALSAILQKFGFFPLSKYLNQTGVSSGRFAGLSNHPNTQASLMCLSLPILLILFRRNSLRLRWFIILGVLFEFSIFLSGSRNGILCSVLIIISIAVRSYGLLGSSSIAATRTAITMFLILLMYFFGLIKYVLQNTRLGLNIGNTEIDESSQGRLALLRYGFQIFMNFPFTGIGPSVLKAFHNIYLQIAGSFGIVGMIAFINYVKNLLRLESEQEHRFEYRLIVYVFLGYGFFNNNLADFYLYFPLGLCYSTLDSQTTK